MGVLLQVPAVFFIVLFLLDLLAFVFFLINPIKDIKRYRISTHYYNLIFFAMGIGYLGIITDTTSPVPLAFINCSFVAAPYFLMYGLLWRKSDFKKHLINDNFFRLNIAFIALMSIFSVSLLEDFRPYRALIVNVNTSLVLLYCTTCLTGKGAVLSTGELVMKASLFFSAAILPLSLVPLFFTENMLLYATAVFIVLSLFTLVTFGSLLTLLLSDVIVFHYKNSVTDPMTGLYNRRYFIEQSQIIINLSKRQGQTTSLIMCDIDKFKNINDSFGHDVGDQVIIEFGEILKACVRDEDILSRFGGEEFLILLPQSNINGAVELAQRIRLATENRSIKIKNDTIKFTASFGVTSFRETDDIENNIKSADEALYKAKEGGRNQVCSLEMESCV
jgi:diguanylate cyclase (GGDEF)-like protein